MKKKIVHIMLESAFLPGFGYQGNILPAKHKELGFEVTILTCGTSRDEEYIFYDEHNIKVIALKLSNNIISNSSIPFLNRIPHKYLGLIANLDRISPDIIFLHGTRLTDELPLIKYKKKHNNVKIFADSHVDYYNSPVSTLKQKISHKYIQRYCSRQISRVCEVVWGVTPWRVTYLHDVLGVPKNKIDLLVMGGDEIYIDWEHKEIIRKKIRTQYNIPENTFLVITGGKIDKAKNIHFLVEAIKNIPNTYLLIFGKYEDDMKSFPDLINCNRILNVGWIASNDSYPLFLASDLVVFPGSHSVLWEQSCACGIPGIFKDWDNGFSHIDVGGNCILLKNPTSEILKENIECLIKDEKKYESMKDVANYVARKYFSYIEIAKKSIGLEE